MLALTACSCGAPHADWPLTPSPLPDAAHFQLGRVRISKAPKFATKVGPAKLCLDHGASVEGHRFRIPGCPLLGSRVLLDAASGAPCPHNAPIDA